MAFIYTFSERKTVFSAPLAVHYEYVYCCKAQHSSIVNIYIEFSMTQWVRTREIWFLNHADENKNDRTADWHSQSACIRRAFPRARNLPIKYIIAKYGFARFFFSSQNY